MIYDGKQSIVVEDLHNNRINQALTYVPRKTTDTSIKKYECEYCGSVVEPDDSGKCPHCNHIIEEYLIRNK